MLYYQNKTITTCSKETSATTGGTSIIGISTLCQIQLAITPANHRMTDFNTDCTGQFHASFTRVVEFISPIADTK